MACVAKGLIIGGGIAGLAAAIALQRIGVKCEVVEIGDEPVGASMSLSGRATDALVELGIYDECYEHGAPFTAAMTSPVMNDAAGRPMGAPPVRPDRPDAKPAIGVFRPTFARTLANEARRLGATIKTGLTVSRLDERVDSIAARFSNGECWRYDFVIGADGIGSSTRNLLFPHAPQPEYAGQMSIRWMIPGPAIEGEGWYVAESGRLGFFHMPKQQMVYVPIVLNMPERRLSQDQAYVAVATLLDSYSAQAVVNLRKHLNPDSILICRPFRSVLIPGQWYHGRTLLIGDAAHATTAHLGMGAGMALEDAVVLAQCIAGAASLQHAYEQFMERRLERVRTVVETSVALCRLEQINAPREENARLMSAAYAAISQPY